MNTNNILKSLSYISYLMCYVLKLYINSLCRMLVMINEATPPEGQTEP